jgi:hypothetical protein
LIWKVFFLALSHTADMLCTEVHKQREKVIGRELIDASRNYTTSKLSCFLYVAAMKGNCVCCDTGCIHSANCVEKRFLNGSKQNEMERTIPTFVQKKLSFATVGLMTTP